MLPKSNLSYYSFWSRRFEVTILEAQKNNCKVLCPKLPIFKEVGKILYFYFKLNDVNDFNFQLSQLLTKTMIKKSIKKWNLI